MLLKTLAAVILGCATLCAVAQQDYPSRPVRLIAPFPPGGVSDTLARSLGEKLTERWKQQVVIDNRPGANTIVAAQELIRQPPDGYSLMLALDMTLVMNQYLYKTPKYDPTRDFTLLTRVSEFPFFLITRSDSGVKTVQEFLALAKKQDGNLNVGTSAVITQLAVEILNRVANVKIVPIQYKGTGDNTLALLRGDVDFIVDADVSAAPHVRTGKLKMLASSGAKRIHNYPDVPTYKEVLPNHPEVTIWNAIVGPAGMPPALVAKLSTDLAWALSQPEIRTMLQERSIDVVSGGQEELKQRAASDSKKYGELIRQLNISLD